MVGRAGFREGAGETSPHKHAKRVAGEAVSGCGWPQAPARLEGKDTEGGGGWRNAQGAHRLLRAAAACADRRRGRCPMSDGPSWHTAGILRSLRSLLTPAVNPTPVNYVSELPSTMSSGATGPPGFRASSRPQTGAIRPATRTLAGYPCTSLPCRTKAHPVQNR